MNTLDVFKRLENHRPSILGLEKYREYAILIPVVQVHSETHLLFEVRSINMRSQPGDVCFPGGKVDQTDFNQQFSAIRETSEELGLDKSMIKNVQPLDYIVSDFGRIIYPFVGELTSIEELKLNDAEVAEVFTVPLSYFLHTEPKKYKIDFKVVPERNFPFDLIQGGKNYNWRTRKMDEYFYEYNNRIIWGLTARIITHFVKLLKAE